MCVYRWVSLLAGRVSHPYYILYKDAGKLNGEMDLSFGSAFSYRKERRKRKKSLIWVIRKNKDLSFIRKRSAIGRGL